MIFDLQLFASVTIDDEAVQNGAVVGQGADVAYTITTVAAQAKIDVESQTDEAKAAIANGATGTVTLNGENIEVTINSDGTVTRNDGGDVDEVIGQVVQFVAGGGSTITAEVSTFNPIYAVNNGSTITGDTVLSGIFAEEDGVIDTTNPYSVTISGGLVTAVSNNDGSVSLEDFEALTLSTNPNETTGSGSANTSTQTTYSGNLTAGGVDFTVNVDANGTASYTANGTALSDNTYTQSDVTVGSYTVTEQALVAGKLTADNAPDIDVSSNAGTATATFSNGVVANLSTSDTSKVISFTVNGVEQTDTSKVTVGDLVYSYTGNSSSGTLIVDATSIPEYAVGITSGTGLDNATFSVQAGRYTLNYAVTSRDAKSSDTVNATLVSVTDSASGTYTVDATAGTFTDANNNVYTATTTVASFDSISGAIQSAGNVTSTETFVAKTGSAIVSFQQNLGVQYAVNIQSTDGGNTWTPVTESDTTISNVYGDTFNVIVVGSGTSITVAATGEHGVSTVNSATYVAAVSQTPDNYTLNLQDKTISLVESDGSYSLLNGEADTGTSIEGNVLTIGDVSYNLSKDSNTLTATANIQTETFTVGATEVLGEVNGSITGGSVLTFDYDGDGTSDVTLYVSDGKFDTVGYLDVTATGTVAAPDNASINAAGQLVYGDITYTLSTDNTSVTTVSKMDVPSDNTVSVAEVLGTDTLKLNLTSLGLEDSEITLQVTFDSSSEISTAQLINKAGNSSDVTVGQLGTFSFGDKSFSLTLGSDAMADGDLTASDVTVVGELNYSDLSTAEKENNVITVQYDKDTRYVLGVVIGDSGDVKVADVEKQQLQDDGSYQTILSTSYSEPQSRFSLLGNGNETANFKLNNDNTYVISFDKDSAPRFNADKGTVSDVSKEAFSVLSTFSHGDLVFSTNGQALGFGTTSWSSGYSALGTVENFAYGNWGFQLSSSLFGGEKNLNFLFDISSANFNKANQFSSGIALGTMSLSSSINGSGSYSFEFGTNFSDLYTIGSSIEDFGGNENSSYFSSGAVANIGTLGANGAQLVLFGTSELWYDSNGLNKQNTENDFTLRLTSSSLTVFAGTNDGYKTTFNFGDEATAAFSTMFTGLTATGGGFGTASSLFGTAEELSGLYSAFNGINGFLGTLGSGLAFGTSVKTERNVFSFFGTGAADVAAKSELGTSYFGTGDTLYAVDVDEDGLYDFYQLGTGSKVYNHYGTAISDPKVLFDGNTIGMSTRDIVALTTRPVDGYVSYSTSYEVDYTIQVTTNYQVEIKYDGTNSDSSSIFSTSYYNFSTASTALGSASTFERRVDYKATFDLTIGTNTYEFYYQITTAGGTFKNVYKDGAISALSTSEYTYTEGENGSAIFQLGTSAEEKYTLQLSTTDNANEWSLTASKPGVTFNGDAQSDVYSNAVFTLGSTVDAIAPKTTYTFNGFEFTTDTASVGTFTTSADGVTYTLNFSSGAIEELTSSTTKAVTVKTIEDGVSREESTYTFSDTTNGYAFTVTSDLTITAANKNGEAISGATFDNGTAVWTDTTKNLYYTATFTDGDQYKGRLSSDDTVVITSVAGVPEPVEAQFVAGTEASNAKYQAQVAIENTPVTVTRDAVTGEYAFVATFSNGSETSVQEMSTIQGYTFEFMDVDSDTTNGQGQEYFRYYLNAPVTVSAAGAQVDITGTLGEGSSTIEAHQQNGTYYFSIGGEGENRYPIQIGTAADGTVYQYISGDQFSATTGSSGSTLAFTATDVKDMAITRTISGAQIAGVAVELYESGTSVNSLTLYAASGTGVALASDGKSITVDGITYQISGSASNYTAKADASAYNLTSSEIVIVPTTYTFSANGENYTVAVQDGQVKSYANNEYGDVVGDIVVKGDIVYTINYDNSAHSASVTGVINGATYTSASNSLTEATDMYLTINGQRIFADSFTDNTYTTQYGGSRYVYTWDGESSSATYYTTAEAVIYNISTNDEVEAVTTLVDSDGNVVSDDMQYVATWTYSDGDETYTTTFTGTASEIGARAAEMEIVGSISIVSQGRTIDAEVGGTNKYSYVKGDNSETTATIIDNVATLSGVTLTFMTGEDGTYTTVNGVSINGDNFTIAGSANATLAVLGEDGVWKIDDTNIDNVQNSTDSPISINANGDVGTLGAGAIYNPETNTLVDSGTTKSAIKNEDGYTTTNGVITGLNEDGTVSYDENDNLILTGLNENTKLNGASLPVTGDDNFNATLNADGTVALDGISDGATLDATGAAFDVTSIKTDEGEEAEVTFIGDVSAKVNGADLAVSGDADGVKVTANDDGISAISGVSNGASITAPTGAAVTTDESGSFAINGASFNVADDEDGVVITPNEDGAFALSGLDQGAMLSSDSDATIAIGDSTYAIGADSSLKGVADGQVSLYTAADKSFDDEVADLINDGTIDSDTPVIRLSDLPADKIITNEDGTKTYDFSGYEAGVFQLSELGDGEDYSVILPEGSTAIIPDGVEGEISIESKGNSKFINRSSTATMNVTAGSGDEITTGNKDDIIDVANASGAKLNLANGGKVNGYDPTAENAPTITIDNSATQDSLMEAIKTGNPAFANGTIGEGDNQITLTDAEGNAVNMVQFESEDGQVKPYAWPSEDGATLDGANFPGNTVFVGNTSGNGTISMFELAENQTAIVGEGDLVKPAVNTTIEMTHNGDGAGASVAMPSTGTGEFKVNGFVGGFNSTANSFRKPAGVKPQISFLEGLLRFLIGGLTAVLEGTTSSAGFIEKNDDSSDTTLIATNSTDYTNPNSGVLETTITDENGENAENYVLIGNEKEYKVASDNDLNLNFVGAGATAGSGVSFDNISDLELDLSTTEQYTFSDIASVQAGSGNSSLTAGDDNTIALVAGSGKTTITSGAGVDTIYGYEGSSETTVIFTEGSGNDVVKNFQYGSTEDSDKFDFEATALNRAEFDGNDLKITVEGGDVLTIADAKNNKIKATAEAMGYEGVVEFGDNLTYDEEVNMYGNYNTEKNKMTVTDSDVTDDVAIYLNGQNEYGQTFDGKYYYNVNEIDASALTKDASIAGYDNLNDTITGGQGANSLWGGLGGDDLLIGGSGQNTFFYLNGDGNDTIQSAKSGDTIELWNTSLSDLDLNSIAENSTTKSIAVKFNNGNTLTVTGTNLTGVGFKLGQASDADVWSINKDKTWSKKDNSSEE